ncbi:winged helix-turn-helix domain-containing protein [Streptomyces sp. URMC 126]|uniref:ArsR/SmtB family transcription factor n=1 Tax=Streptomyces sp. URMC 126 TaxID=3423401 RepID=UPI003F1D4E03
MIKHRIHFTAQDLARTRIADTPHPLLEVTIAARMLQETCGGPVMRTWQREVGGRLDASRAGMVLELNPPRGWAPRFLHPFCASGDAREALELARATPGKVMDEQMAFIAERQRPPRWAEHLHDDIRLRRQLFDGLQHVYEHALAPYWPRIRARLEADRALRTRDFASGGMERVLAGLQPGHITWKPPVLEVTGTISRRIDLHLDGRGLLLIPSWYGHRLPLLDPHAEPQPFLTYPAHREAAGARPDGASTGASAAALGALLGHTRAAVLLTIADRTGCTTTEIARRVGISAASASEHTSVLRSTGLVTTARHRNTALHTATPTALALLGS